MKQTVKNVEEVKAILTEYKDEVARRYRVTEISIFGSFARGEQRHRSDIDILVEFDQRIPGLLKLIELERFLEKDP